MKRIAAFVITFCSVWASAFFVAGNASPMEWAPEGRFFVLAFAVLLAMFIAAAPFWDD